MVDLILTWASDAIAVALEFFFEIFMPLFGFDFTTFANAFPFAQQSYYIFQAIAISIATLVGAYHLFPFLMSWFGVGLNKLRSNPIQEIMQVILSIIMIFFGNHILTMLMEMAKMPFDAIMTSDATVRIIDFEISPVILVLDTIFLKQSVLLYIIMLGMIGWQLVKLLLEAIERYLILFVLVYLSPLASATLASEETSGIFKKYFNMFLSQCLLLILNVWSLQMVVSLFSNIEGNKSPVLALIMGYSFLRLAQRFDSYLNQVGLNAAVTGAGLGTEMLITGASLLRAFGGNADAKSESTGNANGGSGGILGAANQIASGLAKFSPVHQAGQFAGSALGSAASSVMNKVGNVSSAAGVYNQAAVKAAADTVGTGVKAATQAFRGNSSHKVQAAMDALKSKASPDQLKQNFTSNVDEMSKGVNSTLLNKRPIAEAQKEATTSEPKFTDNMHNLVSHNAHAATTVYDTFAKSPDYECTDAPSISSVMRGIGADKADPVLKDFTHVGYGYQDGISTHYKLNDEGITAEYLKGNTVSKLNVINESQFKGKTFVDQQGYQSFKAEDGSTYYWRATKNNTTQKH